MSFYRRRPSLGFAWVPMVAQVVGGALQSRPVEGTDIPPIQQTNPAVVAIGLAGAAAVVGGLIYFAWRG